MRNKRKHLLVLLPVLFMGIIANAQEAKLTLEECYRLARENYPAIQKRNLIEQTSQFTLENAGKGYLPQVSFTGQATYQSQVVGFPALAGAAGAIIPQLRKDQYKIAGEVDQQIFDGGATHHQDELTKANEQLQQQNLEVNLYALRDRINSLYFSILLMDAQLAQNDLNKANLQTTAQKTRAALKNGVAYRSNVDELDAEINGTDMSGTEFKANRTAYLRMLSMFIGKDVSSSGQLETPAPVNVTADINRPELKAYDLQKAVYDAQEKQLKVDYLPKLNAFFQGAYGAPTLNIIDNSFGWYYYTGVRLNWSLGSLYTLGNQKKILNLNRQSIDADKATFLLNTRLDMSQQDEQVNKYKELIEQDNQTIKLRGSVLKSAQAQLDNGVITTHEYIQQSNAENMARQSLILHQVQLLQAQYNQKYKSGN